MMVIYSLNLFAEQPIIRVRLSAYQKELSLDFKQVKISTKDCMLEIDCEGSHHFSSKIKANLENGLILLKDQRSNKVLAKSKSLYLQSNDGFFKGNKLPKLVHIFTTANTQLNLVAYLDLETYIQGVLPAEMPASWPIESLKAQSIAARSYVLHQLRAKRFQFFDVEGDVMDQVFAHLNKNNKYYAKIKEVVSSTKGEVLSMGKHALKAYFHSHCGGHTELASKVWAGGKGYVAVKDPYCVAKGKHSWNVSLGHQQIKNWVENSTGQKIKSIDDIKISFKNFTGRVEQLVVKSGSENYKLDAKLLRSYFGYSKIKSTKFKLSKSPTAFILSGTGYGHGVGMCQHGAKAMALAGHSYKEILNYYYPNRKIAHWDKMEVSEKLAQKNQIKSNIIKPI